MIQIKNKRKRKSIVDVSVLVLRLYSVNCHCFHLISQNKISVIRMPGWNLTALWMTTGTGKKRRLYICINVLKCVNCIPSMVHLHHVCNQLSIKKWFTVSVTICWWKKKRKSDDSDPIMSGLVSGTLKDEINTHKDNLKDKMQFYCYCSKTYIQ